MCWRLSCLILHLEILTFFHPVRNLINYFFHLSQSGTPDGGWSPSSIKIFTRLNTVFISHAKATLAFFICSVGRERERSRQSKLSRTVKDTASNHFRQSLIFWDNIWMHLWGNLYQQDSLYSINLFKSYYCIVSKKPLYPCVPKLE